MMGVVCDDRVCVLGRRDDDERFDEKYRLSVERFV